jgi:predicted MPP superfamily phosphohydrolase
MFGTILISVFTLMHVYVFWRTASARFCGRTIPRNIHLACGAGLWGLFFGARYYGHHGTGILAMILEMSGMIWLAVLFLVFVSLLAVELVSGFGFLFPRLAPSMRGAGVIVGGMLSIAALSQGLRAPVVESYEVVMAGLPADLDGKVIVAISDLHLGSLRGKQWFDDRVSQIRAQQPDLVVLLGDLFEGHGIPERELVAGFQRLSAPLGVFAVLGNHEFHGDQDDITGLIEQAGITVLRNRWVEVASGLVLAGVDDLRGRRRSRGKADLINKALAGRPAGATVLLSHTPWYTDRAASAGAGLMLSGHTHGGQIWPFDYLVRHFYPFLEGKYEIEDMTLVVGRGTGLWGPPMRLWSPGEISRVTLRCQ